MSREVSAGIIGGAACGGSAAYALPSTFPSRGTIRRVRGGERAIPEGWPFSVTIRKTQGSSGYRAERAAGSAADPPNLIWVMPAEEGRVSNEMVVVVAGGEAPEAASAQAVSAN